MNMYMLKKFETNPHATIGIKYSKIAVQHKNKTFDFGVWDTSGNSGALSLLPLYIVKYY